MLNTAKRFSPLVVPKRCKLLVVIGLVPSELCCGCPSRTNVLDLREQLRVSQDLRSSWSTEGHTEKYWGCVLKLTVVSFTSSSLPQPCTHTLGKALPGNSATPSPLPPSSEEQETFQNCPPAAQHCYCFSQKELVPKVSLLNLTSSHTHTPHLCRLRWSNWESIFKMYHLCSPRVKSLGGASGLPLKVQC